MRPDFSTLQELISQIAKAAIDAANPGQLLSRHIAVSPTGLVVGGTHFTPSAVIVVSVGKAAVSMARNAAVELGPYLKAGVVIGKSAEPPALPPSLQYYQGSHPIPDQRSIVATSAAKSLLSHTRPDELVLCLISGGASALLTDPVLPLPHWQELNQALLASGCTINEVNAIRQRFDNVKGGGLAEWASPAACVSLILSDVIGNNLEIIGSGPTVPLKKDSQAVRKILNERGVWGWLDVETADLVKTHLDRPAPIQKPRPGQNHHLIIGDVSTATTAATQKTAEWGFQSEVVSNTLTGEARDIGQMAASKAQEMTPNSCLIWGGESTVTLRGAGRGGRNQEIALAAALAIQDIPGCVVAAFSTDAEDGSMPVAGAFVTNETAVQAQAKGLEPAAFLANNDSYTFFERLGIGHITAETGTNVNDVLVLLRGIPANSSSILP